MIYNPDLPDYSNDMYLKGFNPYEILEAFRRTEKKKRDKKREESIFEKETLRFIEGLATAAINKADEDMFEPFQ